MMTVLHERLAIITDKLGFSLDIQDHDILRDIIQNKIIDLDPLFLLKIRPYHLPLYLILTDNNKYNIKHLCSTPYKINISTMWVIMNRKNSWYNYHRSWCEDF